jgi:hypothetical protein
MRGWIGGSQRTDTSAFFADHALARRIESAWDQLGVENAVTQRMRNQSSGAEAMAVGGGHAVFMGAGSPLSQAQGLGLVDEVREDDLTRLEEFFRRRQTCPQIEVASLASPGLLTSLCQRGFLITEQTHSLVCPLKEWRSGPWSSAPSDRDIEIVRVAGNELEHWVDILMRCFFEEPHEPPPMLREGALSMCLVPGLSAWLARVGGRPAGGGSLLIRGGLALICGDGTLPAFRHRGVQTALLRARLAHAAAAGCDLATICTQPGSGSQRNAERQGFRVVYARTMMVLP